MNHHTRILALLVTCLLLAGCGGGKGNDEGNGNDEGGGNGTATGGTPPAGYSPPTSNADKPLPGAGRTPGTPVTKGPLSVEASVIDLGTVGPLTKHDVTFELRNTGSQPIQIISAKPTCACTAPQNIAGTTIAPGQTFPFSTGFRAPVVAEPKDAAIKLGFVAGGQTYSVDLVVQAQVDRWVRAEPPYVDALKGKTNGTILVASSDGQPFRILSANGAPPRYADGFDPESDTPRSEYQLQWHVPARASNNCEGMRLWYPIVTDHPDSPVLPMYIRHECSGGRRDLQYRSRGWYFDEYIGDVGAVKAGEAKRVEVDLRNAPDARSNPAGLSVVSLSPDATARLVSSQTRPGGTTTCVIEFTPRADYSGLIYALVDFRSATGNRPIGFIGKVE